MLIRYGLPVSRFSGAELHRLVIELAVNEASASTIWRSVPGDALKPWRQRSWIYPRDPFAEKAASALDLNRRVIYLPVQASRLNQIELYFSILQRKALNPNDLATLDALAERLLGFGEHYRQIARPFEWAFTRQDRNALLARIERHELSSPWPHNRQKLRARLLGPVGLGGDDGELGASSVLDVSRELPLEFWPPDGAALRWRWAAPRPGRAAGAATTPTRVGVPVVSVLPPRRQLADEENDSQRHEYRRDGRYRPGDRRASGRCPDVRNEGGGLDMRQIDPVHRR